MQKKARKLHLHRETLRALNPIRLAGVLGGDNDPPLTRTQVPSEGCDTHAQCTGDGCPQSLTCDSIVIC